MKLKSQYTFHVIKKKGNSDKLGEEPECIIVSFCKSWIILCKHTSSFGSSLNDSLNNFSNILRARNTDNCEGVNAFICGFSFGREFILGASGNGFFQRRGTHQTLKGFSCDWQHVQQQQVRQHFQQHTLQKVLEQEHLNFYRAWLLAEGVIVNLNGATITLKISIFFTYIYIMETQNKMLRMLSGKYTHKFLENGDESFSNNIDTIIIPRIEGITIKGFLLTSYSYKVLENGDEMFSNMTHTIIIPK